MPTFKPKTAKKIKFNKKSSITLDSKHKEFLNEFSKDEQNKIPELKLEREQLKNSLQNNCLTIDEQLDCQDKINEITQMIKDMKYKKKEYFLDNSKYIFDYFENKKHISDGTTNPISDKTKILNSFFKINKPEIDTNKSQIKNCNNVQKYLSNRI